MIVDETRKLVFLHNPKCGGTSVRTELLRVLGVPDTYRYQGFFEDPRDNSMRMENMAHLSFDRVASVLDVSKYHFFGIVRDPLHRFISAIQEFESKHSEWYGKFNLPLVDFLWEMLTPESIWLPEFSWFKPQRAFFPPDNSKVRCRFFRIEHRDIGDSLSRYLAGFGVEFNLPHLNAKSGSPWFQALSGRDRGRIYTLCNYLYEPDYQFFPTRSYPRPELTQPLNQGSYMWKVRSVQTPKIRGGVIPPCPNDSTLYEQIQSTKPFTLHNLVNEV